MLKSLAEMSFAGALLTVAAVAAFLLFDHHSPPPATAAIAHSAEIVDADGKLLRAFATKQGRWRLKTRLAEVDSEFIKLLIAYEDKRFWSHPGVDIRAMLRAIGQLIANGRIVSGASTITMQLARLLEPREKRSLLSKVLQIARALQLEARLTKTEIMELYLTLAPYGGNLEGVRAAALAYFGKEPKGLTLAQSALLVALPQSPERRRPDRFAENAEKIRNRVLARAADIGVIAPAEVARASGTSVSGLRHALPHHAAHLAQRMIQSAPDKPLHQLTLKRELQQALETVARDAAMRIDPNVAVAMVLADAHSGRILAEVGSPDYLNLRRSGWVDMSRALRSPGSALKPFIYGLAFEEGLVKPETFILDAPANFAGYRPQNFDMKYQGEISVRKALQLSLNVPAIHLLEAVGPARLLAKFNASAIETVIPPSSQPGLAVGLGGIGISLRSLTQLYTALANGGRVAALHHTPEMPLASAAKPASENKQLLQPDAAWHVTDILSGTRPPVGAADLKIAYKTGTSYGYRDAWAVGYDGRHVLGVWVGRADNGSVPGITGQSTAAPILFEAFTKSGVERTPFKPAPPGALRMTQNELPVTLRRFSQGPWSFTQARLPEPPPQIIYPPADARVELGKTAKGNPFPLVMKLQDGRPPFRWLANGRLLSANTRNRTATWQPDGRGYSTLTVIDAGGRAASVNIFIQASENSE